ncbi:MAG: hypothetical protein JRJ73_00475 [Deltaproteobacteria bacterium]|nr:hypothetical protein [Deltaproteobacteria bacterium]
MVRSWFGLKALPNLKIQELIAVKKKKGGFGLTLNRVYFWNVYRAKANYVYEVHQLELLDHADQEKIDLELRTLSKADVLFTTTYQLLKVLQEYLPGISIVPIGLACNSKNLKEEPVPETGGESAFTVLYIGSLYRQQGIEWLVKNWGHVKPSADSQLVLV